MIQSPPLQLPTDWLVLSDLGLASQSDEALLETGIFVAEMMLPLPPATVLIDARPKRGLGQNLCAGFHDLVAGAGVAAAAGQPRGAPCADRTLAAGPRACTVHLPL